MLGRGRGPAAAVPPVHAARGVAARCVAGVGHEAGRACSHGLEQPQWVRDPGGELFLCLARARGPGGHGLE